MRRFACAVLLVLLAACGVPLLAEEPLSLRDEMQRLNVRSVLLVRTSAIDEYPVWSPNGADIALNIGGTWRTVGLSNPTLSVATWHDGQSIGILEKAVAASITPSRVASWAASGKRGPRRVEAKGGTVVELLQAEIGTSLVITKKGEKPEILWTSRLESCHDLALSPAELYVALICETNGLIVTALR